MLTIRKLLMISILTCAGFALYADDTLDQDMAVANRLSRVFSKVADQSFSAVVVIENLQTSERMTGGMSLPPELEYFFGKQRSVKPSEKEGSGKPIPVGFGSGVLIREDGYIVTNQHVINNAKYLRVRLQDGTLYDNYADKDAVQIIGVDEQSDVAILKLSDKNKKFHFLKFADSDQVSIGDWAIAIGAPFNYDYTLTVGIVSQKGRHGVFQNRTGENYIQTDASINPGNSGGPLLNIKGEIMGINNFIANGGGVAASAGLGFAIASNIVKSVSDQLIMKGKVSRPWLGIMMADLKPMERKNFSIEKGVLVKEVLKDNPADKAGLKSGDVILKVGNEECNTAYDVQTAVLKHAVGENIQLTILRNQKEKTLHMVAALRDSRETAARSEGGVPLKELGLSLKESDGALVVEAVDESSEAYAKDIRPGTKVISVNRKEVKTIDEFQKVLDGSKGDSVMLKLSFKNKEFIEFLNVE